GCDTGTVRGLVFCISIEECNRLCTSFNENGLKSVALTGDSKEQERETAIQRLESDGADKIDYIFTRDIFNEGVDIPRVNQIILLRPTESAIVFVQQLGRGLRKTDGKEFLTVIDFIGNYRNNYLVPIALFGDTSYNKDRLRKLMVSGSSLIPGASTVNFDAIAKKRIYEAIDSANMKLKRDLDRDYELLKFKIGRTPTMVDFLEHGSRDPYLYVENAGSFYEYVSSKERKDLGVDKDGREVLKGLSTKVANGKRIEDVIILQALLEVQHIDKSDLFYTIKNRFGYTPSDETFESCARSINMEFVGKPCSIVEKTGDRLSRSSHLDQLLQNPTFTLYLKDLLSFAELAFEKKYQTSTYKNGFFLYEKYSREDALRILNWSTNPVAQNVGGYITHPDKNCFVIFVTYHKSGNEQSSTDYEDRFLGTDRFEMISKNNRSLNSPEIKLLANNRNIRIPFFLKKSNDEGKEFYYLGDVIPDFDAGAFEENLRGKNQDIKAVKVLFKLQQPVSDDLYEYFTDNSSLDIK
ncbi:MAG: helicase of box family, partial [Flaviaesturariibacter sp.]|nr:helicase of box family [Flaviaesturariibacter sp.]